MAKKKAGKAKKAAPKKKAPALKVVPKKPAKKAAKRTASPRSQVLPGMEQVRNIRLIKVCEGLEEVRKNAALLADEDADLLQRGMEELVRDKRQSYTHGRIELTLSSAGVKIRARLLKDAVREGTVPASEPKAEDTADDNEAPVGAIHEDEDTAAEA